MTIRDIFQKNVTDPNLLNGSVHTKVSTSHVTCIKTHLCSSSTDAGKVIGQAIADIHLRIQEPSAVRTKEAPAKI